MRRILATAALLALAAAGCSSFDIADSAGTKQPGIPFYVKVPVATHETLHAMDQILVQFKVSEILQADEQRSIVNSTDVPAGDPLRLPDTTAIRTTLESLAAGIPRDRPYAATVSHVQNAVNAVLVPLQDTPVSSATCALRPPRLVANGWSLGWMADPRPYYIETKQPFIGSANFAFKFAADGTMTEASAQVTDDTAKTVLSMIPVTSLLTKQWGLQPANDPSATAANMYPLLNRAPDDRRPPPAVLRKSVTVDLSRTTAATLYTLRQSTALGAVPLQSYLALEASSRPLALCDGFLGANGVQLVSIVAPGGRDSPKSGPDDSAWQLHGTVTPPKQAASQASER